MTATSAQIASMFFKAEDRFSDEDRDGTVWRTWIKFITKKQVNWLFQTKARELAKIGQRIHQHHGHDFTGGEFELNGETCFWEAQVIKGGAAQFKVQMVVKRSSAEMNAAKETLNAVQAARFAFFDAYAEIDLAALTADEQELMKLHKDAIREAFLNAAEAVRKLEE